MSIKDVFENPDKYNFNITTLGEGRLDTPVCRTKYVEENERVLISHNLL